MKVEEERSCLVKQFLKQNYNIILKISYKEKYNYEKKKNKMRNSSNKS